MKALCRAGLMFFFSFTASLSAAPWTLDWSQLIVSDNTESTAVLLGRPSGRIMVAGTTFGKVTEPASDPPDLFRAVFDSSGNRLSVEQFGGRGGQNLRGAARSIWGRETLLIRDYATQGSELVNRSASGRERWRLAMPSGQSPTSGVVVDWLGNHWVATRPNLGSMPYAVAKISGSGRFLWSRDATGADRLGMPVILRRSCTDDLVVGLGSAATGVACYDAEMRQRWYTALEPKTGILRDIAFDCTGRLFVTMVNHELRDWHTRLWCLAKDGKVLGSVRVKGDYFSGWRVAADRRGRVYVAGMEYGEPGYPMVVEFNSALQEVGRFYVDRKSTVFIGSLDVTPDGRTLTMVGTANRRWFGKPTAGSADAFVVRCRRRDTGLEASSQVSKPDYRKPSVASAEWVPW